MTEILMTKTDGYSCYQSNLVLNFGHSNFNIVSDFGFRYSNFYKDCFISVDFKLPKSGTELLKHSTIH